MMHRPLYRTQKHSQTDEVPKKMKTLLSTRTRFKNWTFASLLAFAVTSAFSQNSENLSTDRNGVTLRIGAATMRIDVWSAGVIRVQYGDAKTFNGKSLAIKLPYSTSSRFTLAQQGKAALITTKDLQVTLNKETGAIQFADASGKILLKEPDAGGKSLSPAKVADSATLRATQNFALPPDEAIFGLGQHQEGLMNYRGHSVHLQQKNTDIGIPMLISSQGYGVLWDNPAITDVSVGLAKTPNVLSWSSEASRNIDYYFLYGPTTDEVISRYRELTGHAPMFGKWAYGYWQSKEHYHTQEELLNVLTEYRKRQIPIDGIVQDWFYWNPMPWGSHQFDPKRYPDPEAMVKKVHELNAHIIISIWSRFDIGSANYDELEKANALFAPLYGKGKFRYYDAFSQKGREIFWRQVSTQFFAKGFDGWWQDATEPELGSSWGEFRNVNTASGPGYSVYNAYPLKATQATYEGQRSMSADKRVFILTRSAFLGQQRNATMVWSGDIGSDWETFKRQIPAGLNFVLTGIPYWNTDIGGFNSRLNTDPDYQECYVRWFQFGSFCPMFRAHGTRAEKSIWSFGPAAEAILIKYDQLRYRLLPYIYSVAWKVTNEGYTMMRPLVMDFAADRNTFDIGDQFMFGPGLMACPVTEPYGGNGTPIPSTNFADREGVAGGLSATYFEDKDLKVQKLSRKDAFLSFNWDKAKREGIGANLQRDPIPGLSMEKFSARWEGFVLTNEAGDYYFTMPSDDGVRLWVGGKLVIDDWKSRFEVATRAALVNLPAKTKIPLKVEYFQNGSTAALELRWRLPSATSKTHQTRAVYLPKGLWHDFWTGKVIEGGSTIEAPAPLETMPIYARAGAIVPLGPVVQYASEIPNPPIELRVYRGANGSFVLYEDEGDNYNYEKGIYSTIPIEWNESAKTLTIGPRKGKFPGMGQTKVFRVVWVRDGHGIGLSQTDVADSEVSYSGNTVSVKAP